MGPTMADDHGQGLRQIARQRVAHLNWRPEIRRTLRENAGEILARMATARHKQRDALSVVREEGLRTGVMVTRKTALMFPIVRNISMREEYVKVHQHRRGTLDV